MKKFFALTLVLVLVGLSYSADIIGGEKASEAFIKSITMTPEYTGVDGKIYSSTTPSFEIKTTSPLEDYESILVSAYVNGKIILDRSVPLGDFSWENWEDSIGTFKILPSENWCFFFNTDKANEIYFVLKNKQLVEKSETFTFCLDGTKPMVKCYDEDGDMILGTHGSNNHDVWVFAELMDPESEIDLKASKLTVHDKSGEISMTYPGEAFDVVEEFPGGMKIRQAVNFASFNDPILAELEEAEGDVRKFGNKIYLTLCAANKSGMKTIKESAVSFDLADPVIRLLSFAGITESKSTYIQQDANNVAFQLELCDPEQTMVNDLMVWTPVSGIDYSTFKLYIDDYLTTFTIDNPKPIFDFAPLPLGQHNIAAEVADMAGRKTWIGFKIQSNCCVGIDEDIVPTEFSLCHSYPNPFNPTTTINYSLAKDSHVMLTIYNGLGNVVETIVNENKPAGYHNISWDASAQPSGVYFYKLTTDGFSDIKKCILLK